MVDDFEDYFGADALADNGLYDMDQPDEHAEYGLDQPAEHAEDGLDQPDEHAEDGFDQPPAPENAAMRAQQAAAAVLDVSYCLKSYFSI